MSIPEEKRHALILYRIEQAKETAEEADLLIGHDKFRAAINRIYYAMFYMLLALGLKYRFETSKAHKKIGMIQAANLFSTSMAEEPRQ